MQFSMVNGQRTLPFPKGQGVCEICSSETLSKCGEKIMWHWAHKSRKDCDPWWENETEWHRQWKEKFPAHFREIVHMCETTGERHRADIKSDKGIILEIQNSPISLEELRSRESFYKNLIWIVNGQNFKARFNIYISTFLPDPDIKEFDDIVFVPTRNAHSCKMFWRKSENPNASTAGDNKTVRLYQATTLPITRGNHYVGHHPYVWKRPHIAWLEAKCPVFVDFGTDVLLRLVDYKNQFRCVQAVAKAKVIWDILRESDITNIAKGNSISKG
jgi:hypothetical protein